MSLRDKGGQFRSEGPVDRLTYRAKHPIETFRDVYSWCHRWQEANLIARTFGSLFAATVGLIASLTALTVGGILLLLTVLIFVALGRIRE